MIYFSDCREVTQHCYTYFPKKKSYQTKRSMEGKGRKSIIFYY